MKLRTVDVIILLVLGLLCVARAAWGLYKDVYIDVAKAKSLTGRVVYAGIIQIEKVTFKSNKYSTVFGIELDGSNEKFAIDRGIDVCNFLKENVSIGDTIKLSYRHSTSEHNTFVYEIEKDGHILANYRDYQEKETKMIILGFVFGVLILGGLIFWYVKKKKQIRIIQP